MATSDRRKRGRPTLSGSDASHSPRLAVRLPTSVERKLRRRAAEEGRTVSEVVRFAVSEWAARPNPSERAELRRLVALPDREREAFFLSSNANVHRMLEGVRPND